MEKKLPKGWVETELREVVWSSKGKKPKRLEEYDFEGALPYLDIFALEKGIVRQYADINSSKVFNTNDIAIVWDGARSGWIFKTRKGVIGSTLCAISPIGFSKNFLYYYLLKEHQGINSNARGVGIPHVDPTYLWNLKLSLPPLAEQERIANKLDELFDRIEVIKASMKKIPQLLKGFRQQVLTSAVTGKLTEEWREGKELENSLFLVESIVNERNKVLRKKIQYDVVIGTSVLPNKWNWVLLNYLGEVSRGKSKHRPRNDKKLFGGKYPFIQTGDVSKSNSIIKNFSSTYNEFGLQQSRLFPKGTLCITIAANIAETGILSFDSCFPDSIVGYIPYKNIYTSEFVMFYLQTIQKDIEKYAPATAQKNINLSILNDIPFPFPPLVEQEEIISRVEGLFAKADKIEEQYVSLKEKIDVLPQLLLHKAFKGGLVEQLPTDGDAADLLKEIMALKKDGKKKKK
ncbi:restriction endonuclease subunit S [Myroides odoratimimus]|uniref:restriction endonuclease subunit S n=1 Tax=Myroides odoratimimus TaxID=76832 RepID=UPI0031013A5C